MFYKRVPLGKTRLHLAKYAYLGAPNMVKWGFPEKIDTLARDVFSITSVLSTLQCGVALGDTASFRKMNLFVE